jgi:hypothetical protein
MELHGIANAAYLEAFPFPALLRVAPYCVPGGVRLVSTEALLPHDRARLWYSPEGHPAPREIN